MGDHQPRLAPPGRHRSAPLRHGQAEPVSDRAVLTHLSIAIQTHPVRRELAEDLIKKIDYPGTSYALDPEPRGLPSPWRTYRHALETTPLGVTHRLVLQDDVQVCRSFAAAAQAAITARPDDLISFYVSNAPREYARAVFAACDRDEPWALLERGRWCPAVALAWPVALIEEFLGYVDQQNWPPRFRADDEIIGRWLTAAMRAAVATVPSLVEHPDDVPSLIGRRASDGRDLARVAACFIHEDVDPLTIDWSR